jgi:hypothetical protein
MNRLSTVGASLEQLYGCDCLWRFLRTGKHKTQLGEIICSIECGAELVFQSDGEYRLFAGDEVRAVSRR